MAATDKQPARSIQIAMLLMHEARRLPHERANEMPGRELIQELEKPVPLDEWARARYEKSGACEENCT